MMARSSNAPSMGRIQKRKTKLSKSSLSACNARPVHTDGPSMDGARGAEESRFCEAFRCSHVVAVPTDARI